MQTTGKFFDDFAKMAGGAMGALGGVKEEAEAAIRQRLERILSDMDVVPRDEFDAMADVARRARQEQETLSAKLAELESRLAALEGGVQKASTKRGAAKKAAARKPKAE
jgi:BMFP domain-containing protein YqiC